MRPDIKPNTTNLTSDPTPASVPSAGDDAALQAIEALESESNQIPDIESPSTPPVAPIGETPAAPTPPTAPINAAFTNSLKDETPLTPTSSFQPFATQKKSSKKTVIILVITLLIIGLGAGGYFGWQYLQAQNNQPAATTPSTTTEEAPAAEPATGDTESGVNTSITEINSQLDGMSDTDYDDTTLSDETLYN